MVAQNEGLTKRYKADILLVTVTEVEMRAVLNVFPRENSAFEQHHIGENTYFDLGVIGGTRTFLVQCEMGAGGKEIITPRGDRVQASPRLLSRLRASIFDWQGPKVHFGLVLSGDKLANHTNFRNKLLGIEREAIGGEMEAT